MATTGSAPFSLPAPQLTDGADIEQAVVPLRDRLQTVLSAQLPTGAMMMWLTATAPLWWLLCNGQDVDAALYPRLAAVIPPVAGRIILPDLRTKMPIGAGTGYTLKASGGEAQHTLSVPEMPSHNHSYSKPVTAVAYVEYTGNTFGIFEEGAVTTGNTGGGVPHNNLPPFLVVNFIIKAE